jgi:AcrR family transcriptional regulator
MALVRDRGAKGFSLREAAAQAGVSSAAPYRHFADREDLLAAVAEDGFRELEARLRRARRKALDGQLAVLEALARAYVKFASDNPEQFGLMFDLDHRSRERAALAEAGKAAFGVLVTEVERAQQSGLFSGLRPIDAATQLWSLVHGISTLANQGALARAGQRTSPERLAVESVRRLVHGDDAGVGEPTGRGSRPR